jgi:hypothetical protein
MKDLQHEEHIEDTEKGAFHHEEIIDLFSPAEQKKLIRRIDIRLVITLGFLYCVSLLDRTNLGAASVAGYVSIAFKISHINTQNPANSPLECRAT